MAKANAPTFTTFVLGVVAGAFIALGAVFSTTVATGSALCPLGLDQVARRAWPSRWD